MDSTKNSGYHKEESRRRRSISESTDSEEERRRKRRRKERESGGRSRDDRPNDRPDDRYTRSRAPDTDKPRRRSRSPARGKGERVSRYRSRSPDRRGDREKNEVALSRKSKAPLPSQAASFQLNKDPSMALVPGRDGEVVEKQKPSLASTGLLAAASNSVTQIDGTAIALKYHEPPEARKPPATDEWKLFVFKGAQIIETIELGIRSCWLIGREISVVDLPAEHPSISKQHAVIQFRYIEKKNEYGDKLGKVRPYLIDLDSANGTLLNKDGVPPSRYLELRDKDMIQFGHSTREYVLMLPPKS